MNNLLKITTKSIKIAIQVEKGHFTETQVPKLKANRIRQSPPVRNLQTSQETTKYVPQNQALKMPEQNIQAHLGERLETKQLDALPYVDAQSSTLRFEPKQVMNERVLTYHPSELEFVVKQYPEIRFDYLGEPIYVPLSSNPDHKK